MKFPTKLDRENIPGSVFHPIGNLELIHIVGLEFALARLTEFPTGAGTKNFTVSQYW